MKELEHLCQRVIKRDDNGEEYEDIICTWFIWFIKAGRGFGKNWAGSKYVNEQARLGVVPHIALLGRDAHDVRAYQIEGNSGILALADNDFMPIYEPSKRVIKWPNGCTGHIYYAEEPKSIRGPNHGLAWADEPASYQDAKDGLSEDTAFSNLLMTMRVGDPKILVTGTPKPNKLVKQLINMPRTICVSGSTMDNAANLAQAFFDNVVAKYKGTRLGRQELEAEILDDNPGALWKREWIERNRLPVCPPDLERIVVAVDPSVAGTLEDDVAEKGDGERPGAEAGIIAIGMKELQGIDHFYVLDDQSIKGTPLEWGRKAVNTYHRWMADKLVGERNNGGAMVEITIRQCPNADNVNYESVWASRGKVTRAEPVSALYEQGRVHHCGTFEELEDQMCNWEPGQDSPDRLDALVWGSTDLMEGNQKLGEDDNSYEKFWKPNDDKNEEFINGLTEHFRFG